MKFYPFLFLLFASSLNAISINFDFENLGTLSIKLDESVLSQSTVSRTQIENWENDNNYFRFGNGSTVNYDSFDSNLYNFLSFPGYSEDWTLVDNMNFINLADELTSNLNITGLNNLDLSNFDTRNDNSNFLISPHSPAFNPDNLFIYEDYTYMFNKTSILVADISISMQDGSEVYIDFSGFGNDGYVAGGNSLNASIIYLGEEVQYLWNGTVTLSSIVPEPSTYALILGAVALVFNIRRRK